MIGATESREDDGLEVEADALGGDPLMDPLAVFAFGAIALALILVPGPDWVVVVAGIAMIVLGILLLAERVLEALA